MKGSQVQILSARPFLINGCSRESKMTELSTDGIWEELASGERRFLSARLAMDYRCSDNPVGESEVGTAGFGRRLPTASDGSCQP